MTLRLPPLPEPVPVGNSSGETLCIVRWFAPESLALWAGSFDKDAIPALVRKDRAAVLEAVAAWIADLGQDVGPGWIADEMRDAINVTQPRDTEAR